MTESDTPAAKKTPRKRAYHERLVAAFIEHTKVADVAAAVDLSERTIQRWRAVPEWWTEVEAARGEVVRDAIAVLRNSLPVAAKRLSAIASESKAEGIAVRAALGLIEAHTRLTERIHLEERLSRIEELVATRPPAPVYPGVPPAFRTLLGGRVSA